MVRPAETIRNDIDSLTTATTALAAEFRQIYADYLNSLGVAVRRQVVMATYHLCTQVYPESFLALSVAQREALQREVRRLGQSGQAKLQQLLDEPVSLAMPADASAMAMPPSLPAGAQAMLRFLPGETEEDAAPAADAPPQDATPEAEDNATPSAAEQESAPPEEETPPEEDEVPLPSLLKSMVMAALAEEMAETFGDPLFAGEAMTPTRLAKQHIFLEQQIRTVLQHISKQVNQRLQAAQVIPNLPEAILDAASETEVGPMRGRAVPNVLSVLVAMAGSMAEDEDDEDEDDEDDEEDEDGQEHLDDQGSRYHRNSFNRHDPEDEDDEDSREGMMTHLAAVNLRLADLEFGNVHCSLGRSKLRTALGRLRKLGKQYQKVQRELAIAEAEQAWRAVWYDES